MSIKAFEYTVLISVDFILQTRMDYHSTEDVTLNSDLLEAINGINPYILPFEYEDLDCNWKCMQCRVVFDKLDKHWHDFHSDTGPKMKSFAVFGSGSTGETSTST